MPDPRLRARRAERLFESLELLYPGAFRDEYAAEMRAVFRCRWRDEAAMRGTAGMALFACGVIWDTVRSACKEHVSMLRQDIKFAFRTLADAPLFAAAAILTIGLGIGVNTAIFSVVDRVLVRPLPFPQSERLLIVHLPHPTEHEIPLSVADFLDWRSQDRTLQSLAAYTNRLYTLGSQGEPTVIRGAQVTGEFFFDVGSPGVSGTDVRARRRRAGTTTHRRPQLSVVANSIPRRSGCPRQSDPARCSAPHDCGRHGP